MNSSTRDIDPHIIEQAAEWLEADDDASPAHAQAFQAWLAAHPDHGRAYRSVRAQMASPLLDGALRAYAVLPAAQRRPAPRIGWRR
ncbi:MAG: FecR/PupR family sigma factor regulator, partial [Solimonas sp.]